MEDPRTRRSRERLHAAVLALAAEGPVDGVTVADVARRAEVHRSTFYEHASSVPGLLQAALLAELDALRDGLLGPGSAGVDAAAVAAVTRGVLEHVARHAAVYRRGLGDERASSGLSAMLADHFLATSLILRDRGLVRPDLPGHDLEDVALRFLAHGTVGALTWWVATDPLDVDAFLAVYEQVLPGWWPQPA